MEIQAVTDCLTSPKKFSLQQIVLHWLAKNCWGDFVLRRSIDGEGIFIPRETDKLVSHRKTVLNNLPRTFNVLPRFLKDKLVNAIFCLQQGYIQALIWEEKCQLALPFTVLNPLEAGEYQAGYFIDPAGHFNDLAWAKRFVADGKQFERCLFKLACLYCFEQAIVELWYTMKINRQLPYEGNLKCMKSAYGDLIGIWVYQLENKFEELFDEEDDYKDSFYACGLTEAIFRGHEYAARFFWERCSIYEKAKFLREPEFDLSDAAENGHAGLVNFIYSILSLEQKNNLISWTNQNNNRWIWYCLLLSQHYEAVLNDISNLSFSISTRLYADILTRLTFQIIELQVPNHQTIFKYLWNHLPLSKQKEVLEIDSYVIKNLSRVRAVDLLKMIIEPLPHSEKEKMLIYDWKSGGKSALDEFCKVGDYDGLRLYLLFFLIDRNAITQRLSLRTDAFSFLDYFIKGEFFIAWNKTQIPESEEKEVNKVIENLQGSITVLYLLLEEVEQMHWLEQNLTFC